MNQPAWIDRHWYSNDGLRLHYRDYGPAGERPPIICLHGLTRNGRDFEDFAARHADRWRIIVPDFRGRGESAWDPFPDQYAPAVYAQDVLKLLARLRLDRSVFVGTSLGGLVTMAIAAVEPNRVAAAVLNDVGPELDPAGLARIATYVGRPTLFQTWEKAAEAIAQTNAMAHPAYGANEWMAMARRLCAERGGAIRFDYDPAIADNFHAARDATPPDAWPVFEALHACPLLVVRGELSDLLSQPVAERMVAAHPAAELTTIPGVGHAPDLSEPAATVAIDGLLERVAART